MRKIILILLFIILIFIIGCAKQIEKPTESPEQQPSLIQEETAIEETPEGGLQQETIQEETKEEIIEEPETSWPTFHGNSARTGFSESRAIEETPEGGLQQETIQEETKEEIIEEPETSWPTFHGNSARTGFSESKAPSKPNVLLRWALDDFMKINYGGNFEGNWPIIDDGRVFIAPEGIFALDLNTGKKVWSYAEKGRSFFPRGLAAGNSKIFISVNAGDNLRNLPPGYVYALDENTGKFLWKYQTQKGISHSLPLFADNNVFIGDDSGSIYALNADDRNLIWKKSMEYAEVVKTSPAFDNGVIFVGTEGSQR